MPKLLGFQFISNAGYILNDTTYEVFSPLLTGKILDILAEPEYDVEGLYDLLTIWEDTIEEPYVIELANLDDLYDFCDEMCDKLLGVNTPKDDDCEGLV